MDWSLILPIVTILVGGSSLLTVGMQELNKWRSGAAAEERLENNDLKATADRASAWRDWADTYRRIIMEKASHWRQVAIKHGASEAELGDWPEPPNQPPN